MPFDSHSPIFMGGVAGARAWAAEMVRTAVMAGMRNFMFGSFERKSPVRLDLPW